MNAQISARAADDLSCIYAFIHARQGVEAADRFLQQARAAVEILSQHPEAGPHPQWATRHEALRFWVIGKTNFLIYYFSGAQGVNIERVLDGRRDVRRIMEEGQESA